MKLGYDGKRAVFNMTGLGNYSRTLLRSLSQYYPDNEYFLYTPSFESQPRLDFLRQSINISVRTPKTLVSRSCKRLWRSYLVTHDLKSDGIELFHGLSNELPFAVTRSGAKSIVTIHDLIFLRHPELYPRLDRKIYCSKVNYACRTADRIVAVSEQTRQDIIGFLDVDPTRIKVVYQSCDPIFYQVADEAHKRQVREKHNLPSQYLLYIGTVERRKNLLGIVKALPLLGPDLDVHLVVIGRGRGYREEVLDRIRVQGLTARVRFLTDVRFADFPAIYQMASAFVLPSMFEGFGIPITEALWSNCPVITSAGGCFAEAGGPSSIYVEPEDDAELASAMTRVLEDSDLATRMRANGYAYVQRFRDGATAAAMMGLYQETMAKAGAQPPSLDSGLH
jgi:glycosyltransferase involved in cell wall biosynthesis